MFVFQHSSSSTLGQNDGWKTIKIGSDVNRKSKFWFWLILTRWLWIYAVLVYLIKNIMNICSFSAFDQKWSTVKITVKIQKNIKIAHFFTTLFPNIFKLKKWNFLWEITLKLEIQAFLFRLINTTNDATAAIFGKKTRALSWPQFWYDFFAIWNLSSITYY